MKITRKIIIALVLMISVAIIAPTVIPIFESAYTVEATSIKINAKKKTLNVKQTYRLKITGTKKKVKWTTSNKKIATVTSNGLVKAKKKGTVTITAKVGSKKYTCKVKVEDPKVNITSKKIERGYTFWVKISGTTQKIKWTTSNKKVATVTSKGRVLTHKVGTATITANVGGKKFKCKTTVKEVAKGKLKALSVAKKGLAKMPFSYNELLAQLKFSGFSHDEAKYGVNNCSANWNAQASKMAKEYLKIKKFSKKELTSILKAEGFKTSEINYAIKSVGY